MSVDLSRLAAPDIVEALDFETIRAAIIADLTTRDPTLAQALTLESEPLVKAIEAFAYRELLLRARVNDTARQCMLAFATGSNLDHLAANLGVTRFDGEGDEALRARAAAAPDTWSVAGPLAAYVGLAKDASPLVADVQATSPSPGEVRIAVLSTAADGVADAGLLATVSAALNADETRPFTDHVTVVSASIAHYDVTATLYIASGLDTATVVAAARASVLAYAAQRRQLGKGVAFAGISAALMVPGVENLVLAHPTADVAAVTATAPVVGTVTLTPVVGGDGV